jgi:5'-deoxy-5'-methylthioadenosine phosphorylase
MPLEKVVLSDILLKRFDKLGRTMGKVLGVIGGSGFDMQLCGDYVGEQVTTTPYGEPSAPLQLYRKGDQTIVFLPRHGIPHAIPPHRINYRANLWALCDYGCARIVAINTVGGIGPAAEVGALFLPDQIIDYTYGREHTFSDSAAVPLAHVDFTEPYSAELRSTLIAAADKADVALLHGGVYGATQGPRLESAAEIRRMQRDGCDLVGMTGMPEAVLARELNLDYVALCLVVNLAAGRGGALSVEAMRQVSAQGMSAIATLIGEWASA